MQTWILFAMFTGALIVVGLGAVVVVLVRNARTAQNPAMKGKYPQGHWMSIGMCIGLAIGCVPSLAGILFEQMSSFVAIGPAIGCGLGIAIGAALEQKHKDEIRPLTDGEQKVRKWATGVGLLLAFLGLLALGGIVLLLTH